MYKVFFNERSITLTDERNLHEWPDYDFIHVFRSREGLTKALKIFSDTDIQNLLIISENLELLKAEFYNFFKIIKAAGGVVENEKGEYLLIFRRGKWDLPKGKAESNEDIAETAVREITEETGIQQLEIHQHLLNTYHVYEIGTDLILKETYWYYLQHKNDESATPQTEEDIEEVRWVSKSELSIYLENTFSNIRLVFDVVLGKSNLDPGLN